MKEIDSVQTRTILNAYGVHTMSIATPMPNFRVNVYLVEGPCPTLIDTPPDHRACLDELNAGLNRLDYSLGDIRRIIVTHPHFDHFGSARSIADRSGAEIWVSRGGASWLEDFENKCREEEELRHSLLHQWGAPEWMIRCVDDRYRRALSFAQGAKPSKSLRSGDRLDLSLLSVEVTDVPGHTPWCILLHDVNHLLAFTGDFLPTGFSANPLVRQPVPGAKAVQNLKSYLSSLRKVREMNLEIALPGHGEVIDNPSGFINDLLACIQARRLKILHILERDRGTPVHIAQQVFPSLPPEKIFIAVSDVLGHLEMLEEDGLVLRAKGSLLSFSST